MTEGRAGNGEVSEDGPIIRDRRRIDPVTGAVRPQAAAAGPAATPAPAAETTPRAGIDSSVDAAERVALEAQLAERTSDLQRVQAEYANYRRRVDRDRDAVRHGAIASALTELLPVLDDIGRATEHGEVVGGFKSVADALDAAVARLGLVRFGAAGEPFDPNRHEALVHTYSDEVTRTTCTKVFQPGYQLGDRVLRPARVAVADPTAALPDSETESTSRGDVGDESTFARADEPETPFGVG